MLQKEFDSAKRQIKHDNGKIFITGFSAHYINIDGKVVASTTKRYCDKSQMQGGGRSGSDKEWDLFEEDAFMDIVKKTFGKLGKDMTVCKITDSIRPSLDGLKRGMSDMGLNKLETAHNAALTFANFLADKLVYNGDYLLLISYMEITEGAKMGDGIHNANTRDDDLIGDLDSWHFITVSICPTQLVKAGVVADKERRLIQRYDGKVKELKPQPMAGFIYPTADSGNAAVYQSVKKPIESLVADVLSAPVEKTPEQEKAVIRKIISESITDEDVSVDDVLEEIIETADEIGIEDVKNVMDSHKIPTDKVEKAFDDSFKYDDKKDKKIRTEPIKDNFKKSKPSVEPLIIVTIKDENMCYEDTISGRECLVIPLNDRVKVKRPAAAKEKNTMSDEEYESALDELGFK